MQSRTFTVRKSITCGEQWTFTVRKSITCGEQWTFTVGASTLEVEGVEASTLV